jgi:hypothetical protein
LPTDTVQITYDGKIGQGSAPGHAKFVANGAIADAGTLIINGRDTGPIVYTKLTFTGNRGTFHVSEKIVKGGLHTWTLTSGTGAYAGLHWQGTETGRPEASGRIHVDMTGVVTRRG